jgi:hypothetical protein
MYAGEGAVVAPGDMDGAQHEAPVDSGSLVGFLDSGLDLGG